MDDVIEEIKAGSLVPNGRLSRKANLFNWLGTYGTAGLAVKLTRKLFGGLWVGGVMRLYSDRLEFEPNALNQATTEGDLALKVYWKSLVKISCRSGMGTGVLDLEWIAESRRVSSFRCDNLISVARKIEELAGKAGARRITVTLS